MSRWAEVGWWAGQGVRTPQVGLHLVRKGGWCGYDGLCGGHEVATLCLSELLAPWVTLVFGNL